MSDKPFSAPVTPIKYMQTQGSFVLARPFRSPVKLTPENRSRKIANTLDPPTDRPDSTQSSPSRHFLFQTSPNSDSPTPSAVKTSRFREKFLSLSNERKTVDPILIKQESSLDLTLRHLRTRLQQISQAEKRERATVTLPSGATISKEESLVQLTDKWRTASQVAAKFLFELAQERVAKMGGVAEFKRRTRKRGFDDDDDDDDYYGESGKEAQLRKRLGMEGNEAEFRRLRDEYDYDVSMHKIQKDEDEDLATGGGEEEFTMEMMLESLNVEYSVVFPRE